MKAVYLTRRLEEGEASSEHVKSLAEEMAERGDEAAIVSFDDGAFFSVDERVQVERADLPFEGDSLFNWSMMLNNELKRLAREAFDEEPDIVHAVDWTAVPGGVALSKAFEIPLVVTFQSTENNRGFEGEHSGMISELEWDGAFEAELAIATSDETRNSLLFDLDVPEDKILQVDVFSGDWKANVITEYGKLSHKKKVKN